MIPRMKIGLVAFLKCFFMDFDINVNRWIGGEKYMLYFGGSW